MEAGRNPGDKEAERRGRTAGGGWMPATDIQLRPRWDVRAGLPGANAKGQGELTPFQPVRAFGKRQEEKARRKENDSEAGGNQRF